MNNTGGALDFDAYIKNSEFKKSIEEMKRSIDGFSKGAEKEFSNVDTAASKLGMAIGGYLSIQAFSQFATQLINVRGEFQKYEAVLTNSLGSQKDASDSLAMLSNVASKTPFQLDALTGAYVKLVNQGFKPTRGEIIQLGDLASSVGKDFDQLAEAILDAQNLEFERLKEFGIKAKKEGENVTFSFKGQQTVVKASSDAIRAYMLSLGDMEGVKGSMEAISKTLVGQVSNLEDAITAMFNKIGTQSEGLLSGAVSSAKFLVDNYEQVGKAIGVLISMYGAYRAAIIVNTVIEKVSMEIKLQSALAGKTLTVWEGLHAIALRQVTAAQLALNTAMKANVIGLVVTALAGLVSYMILFKKSSDGVTEAQKQFKEESSKSVAEMTTLFDALKKTNAGTEERAKVIVQLNSKYPDYMRNLSLEKSSLIDIEKAQKAVSNAMLERMAVDGKTKELTDITEFRLATLKSLRGKTTKEEFAQIQQYIAQSKEAATYTFDAVSGKLKSNFVFKSWGTQIDNLITNLSALDQQQADVSKTWDDLLATMQEPINAEIKINKTTTTKPGKDVPEPDLTNQMWEWEKERNAKDAEFWNGEFKDYMGAWEQSVWENAGKASDAAKKKAEEDWALIVETMGLETKLFFIRKEYAEKLAKLRKAPPGDLAEAEVELKRQENEKLEAAKTAAFQQSEIGKKLSQDLLTNGRKELQARISNIKKALAVETLSAETRRNLYKDLAEAERAINDKTVNGLEVAESVMRSMVNLAGTYNEELANSIETAAELVGVVKQVATGNYVGAALSLVAMAADIYADIRKSETEFQNKRIEDESNRLSNLLNMLSDALQWQETLIERAFGTDKIMAFTNATRQAVMGMNTAAATLNKLAEANNKWVDDNMKEDPGMTQRQKERWESFRIPTINPVNINSSAIEIDKAIKANDAAVKKIIEWNKKLESDGYLGSKDFDKALEEYEKYYDDLAKLQEEKNQYITGTTSQALTDDIVSMFEQGKTSAADFAMTFENLMKKAMLQALKMKALEGPISAWFDKFALQFSQGAYNSYEWLQQMQLELQGVGANATAMWEIINQNFGSLFGGGSLGGSDTTLTGAVKGVTEETASILAGTINAIRMNQSEMIDITRDQLLSLHRIEGNTRYLLEIRNLLRGGNTGGATNSMRSLGMINT
jgi:hypothetical protein